MTVHWIRPENYHDEIIAEKKIVLLLCMHRDDEFPGQLQIVQEIARIYQNELKVVLPEGDAIDAFKRDFSIAGTPTFLILKKGKEICRMLGLVDLADMRKFVDKALRVPEAPKTFLKRIMSLIFMAVV